MYLFSLIFVITTAEQQLNVIVLLFVEYSVKQFVTDDGLYMSLLSFGDERSQFLIGYLTDRTTERPHFFWFQYMLHYYLFD